MGNSLRRKWRIMKERRIYITVNSEGRIERSASGVVRRFKRVEIHENR